MPSNPGLHDQRWQPYPGNTSHHPLQPHARSKILNNYLMHGGGTLGSEKEGSPGGRPRAFLCELCMCWYKIVALLKALFLCFVCHVQVLNQAWPFFGMYMEKFLKENIQPAVRLSSPALKTFSFTKIHFGHIVRLCAGIKVTSVHTAALTAALSNRFSVVSPWRLRGWRRTRMRWTRRRWFWTWT